MRNKFKRRSPPDVTGRPMFGPGIVLALTASEDGEFENPRWVQIAREGEFKGHPDHRQGFKLTRELFERTVENFRRSPAYKAGPDGLGTEFVIPYDYEHASEMPATEGSIPQEGAVAPAWALDLKVDDGEGGAELWAWSWLGDRAVAQVRAKEYRWTSMALWANALDPETGEDIGPYLSSIALTNHPFIAGMAPIAARAYISEAETPEEALVGLRSIFGLPADATVEAVSAELSLFGQMLSSGALPEHIEPAWILQNIRDLLSIRILATPEEVIAAALALVSGAGGAEPPLTQTRHVQEPKMPEPTTNLSLKLSQLFKVRDNDEAILAAATEGQEAIDAIDKLKQLFEAPDIAKTIEAAVALVAKVGENADLLQTIEQLKTALAGKTEKLNEYEDAEAVVEADAVVASRVATIPESGRKVAADTLRPVILAARKACIGDPAKLEAFRKEYPLPDKDKLALTQRIFAGPDGQQLGSPETTGAPPTQPLPPQAPQAGSADTKHTLLRSMPGANSVEKAMAYLADKEPGFKALNFADQVKRAGRWLEDTSPAAQ